MEEDLMATVETEPEDATMQATEEGWSEEETALEEGAGRTEEPETPQTPLLDSSAVQDWARWRQEQQRSQAELARLTGVLEQFGYAGSAQEIADSLEAAQREISPEEVRQERERQEAAQQERAALEQEVQSLRQREAERVFAEDLAAVQALDKGVKRLEDLGTDFFRLRGAGVSTEAAYLASRSAHPKAPSTGKLGASAAQEKDFFTRDEVAAMSQRDVERHFDAIRNSQAKWR